MQLILYYYATDPEIKSYRATVANTDTSSTINGTLIYDTRNLYDNNFNKVGTLARVLNDIYISEEIIFDTYMHNIILDNGTITLSFNGLSQAGQIFFTPGVEIPLTYQYGTGDYYNKNITGFLLPFGNNVRSRAIVLNIDN